MAVYGKRERKIMIIRIIKASIVFSTLCVGLPSIVDPRNYGVAVFCNPLPCAPCNDIRRLFYLLSPPRTA